MATIRMTPEELRESASFLGGKRGEIVAAVEEIKSRVDATTAEWEGAAQSSFITSFEEMLPLLTKQFPDTIEGIESMLTGAAEALEQADSQIASAFSGS